MRLNTSQGLAQQQKQILTTQMRHSLQILEMPIVDLKMDISKKVEENPLLEAHYEADHPRQDELEKLIRDGKRTEKEYSFSDTIHYNPDKDVDPLNFVTIDKTLKDFLKEQLVDVKESHEIKSICIYIIENLDKRGYLSDSVENIAKDLHCSLQDVEYALQCIQQFEPDGIAARNLIECLEIQIAKKGIEDEKLTEIIQYHLHLIAENKLKNIATLLNISMEEVQEYISIIKDFEPKPSRGFFTGDEDIYIIPEAYIEIIDGEVVLILNDKLLPTLAINQYYATIAKEKADKEANRYVKEKLNDAKVFIKAVDLRKDTISQVLQYIVEKQGEYFCNGLQYLKPMSIGEVAEQLHLSESTISRAIKEKYILTPHGMVKIRDLFTSGIKSTGNKDDLISTNSIMFQIKEFIDAEDKYCPLSDEAIAKALKENGVKIARRTVAKYREELEIPSSSKRKQYK
ncbi:RNA polymerase RpoN-/SigL-like sigma 54 subunit [Alkalibaculum bacchi]|uniref:RNA polymerase RpoN-/SigL-like sigma 54 subunit n=1 Tax=Alkalibaculum bacchi TaxID=645887 RepID=A0A366IIT1_9FIRM|nr:RNA polymerase factor sigma-54 [Alkalibaculum bacchi]RBP70188.1 RNA polymerase RpoN-/SigL-like sigma 54 subunit [Alkalibaculum bacchi]